MYKCEIFSSRCSLRKKKQSLQGRKTAIKSVKTLACNTELSLMLQNKTNFKKGLTSSETSCECIQTDLQMIRLGELKGDSVVNIHSRSEELLIC